MRIDHEDTWLEHFHGYLRLQYLPHSAQRFPHFVHDWKVRLTEQLPHSLHDVHIDWILVTFCSLSFQVNKALFILHIFQTSSYAHSCYPFVATISWLQIQLRAGFDWQVCGEINLHGHVKLLWWVLWFLQSTAMLHKTFNNRLVWFFVFYIMSLKDVWNTSRDGG